MRTSKGKRTHGVGGLWTGDIILIQLRLSLAEQVFELATDGVTRLDDLLELSFDGGQSRRRFGRATVAPGLNGVTLSYKAADLNGPLAKGYVKLLNSLIGGGND